MSTPLLPKTLLLLTWLLFSLGACQTAQNEDPEALMHKAEDASPNMLTVAEKEAGWHLLFDGTSLDQWRGYHKDHVPKSHWIVDDGSIHKIASGDVPLMDDGQPMDGGDIITIEKYNNFEFSFDWKVSPAANSGIKYNVAEEMSEGNPLGFEYQILEDEGHPDAKMGNGTNRTSAGLYDLIGPENKVLNPIGEWNHGRIIFNKDHGEHWLNGNKVLEYDLDTPRMDSLLAASKYAPIENFGKKRIGHIVLQDHNDEVWYRNLKVREL